MCRTGAVQLSFIDFSLHRTASGIFLLAGGEIKFKLTVPGMQKPLQ